MIKAVIFDLDGTITEPFFDFDLIREQIGLDRNSGPIWEAMQKMSQSQRERANEILDQHEKKAVAESRLNPGARKTLQSLKKANIRIGILTRNTKENVSSVAKKHDIIFDEVIGREDGPVKPDAFGVLSLCRKFDVKPSETIVVGDYLYDLLCAKAAGATAVLLKNHKDSDDFAHHADFIIEKIDQILRIIEAESIN